MFKENIFKTPNGENNSGAWIVGSQTAKQSNNVKITGVLTSAIRPKPSANIDFYGFLRPFRDCEKHSRAECEAQKCQECEIPVVFKINVEKCREFPDGCYNLRPNLNKGQTVILEGNFENSKKSHRPSFTCYSYQIINDYE